MWKILLATVFLFFAGDVLAWGFETHIKIGLSILENTSVSIISQFPSHFLLGNIFPDFFNLFKNFSDFKKNLNTHSWKTVSLLFKNSTDDKAKAFAYGYSAHLSADIIAHNYFIPNYYLTTSNKKIFAHFLTESAEESLNFKKFKNSLYYLLDNAHTLGGSFLKINNVDEGYFKKQIRYIKMGLFYQYTLGVGNFSKLVRQKGNAKFEEECKHYQNEALKIAKECTENGFCNLIKYDPNGKTKMEQLKNIRNHLINDFGKQQLEEMNLSELYYLKDVEQTQDK